MESIELFGVAYPAHSEKEIKFESWLPDFFAQQKSFSDIDYYNEMVKSHPKFKKKLNESTPSEQEIIQYLMKRYSYFIISGATSVPNTEEKLGIKIGGKYKYPDGMTDIEYNAKIRSEVGFFYHSGPAVRTKEEAYMEAWQNLHFSKDKILKRLQYRYDEIVELNPKLANIRIDKNNPNQLHDMIDGVTFDFPIADIQHFIDVRSNCTNDEIVEKDILRQNNELAAAGLDGKDFQWILSTETINDIENKIATRRQQKKAALTQKKDDFIKALSMRISTARTDDESELSHPIQSTKQPRNTDRQQSNRLHMLIAKIKGICNH